MSFTKVRVYSWVKGNNHFETQTQIVYSKHGLLMRSSKSFISKPQTLIYKIPQSLEKYCMCDI